MNCAGYENEKHDFKDVHEKCVGNGSNVISGIPNFQSIFGSQIHYSVTVNLIKY